VTAQDGLRVRACAGACSFRRRATLEEARRQAQGYLEQLRRQGDEEGATPRQRAARLRAAEERLGRLEGALGHLGQLERQRQGLRPDLAQSRAKHEPRASTTDPECRKMKMPDGGYRPGYNAQLDTAVKGGVIVAVEVTNEGTDYGQVLPMLGQVEGQGLPLPKEHLVDGGFAGKGDIEAVAQAYPGVELYAPVKDAAKQEAQGKDPYKAKRRDGLAVAAWRARMGTAEGKCKYRLRAQAAEWANAQLRNRGLYQVRVRGLAKVRAVLLWQALAHDLTRWLALRAAALAKAS